MFNIYAVVFLLLLTNAVVGCALLYVCATTLYNRARYGTDTRPSLEQRQLRTQRKTLEHQQAYWRATYMTANTTFLRAWKEARQHEEEVVPVIKQ